ncbi:PQQ-like beta-propeller repeat protein, partial [Rubripirellula amarantea]|nr:PQQ-like beta-propeller repeat protein [Rubripirellula amarantea]
MANCKLSLAMLVVLLFAHSATADEWARFRGPNGTGVAPPLDIPNSWSESDFAWQAGLPGVGHSSPVVSGDQVYITAGDERTGAVHLEAYDVETGKRAWRQSVEASARGMNNLNAYASTTPAVDDKHVYLTYYNPGSVTLVAYTHAGNEVWRRDLGDFTGEHGFSVSPIVVGDLVCLQNDDNDGGCLMALDVMTGDERWRVERSAGKHAYSTPATMRMPDGTLAIIFTSKATGITAVDAKTGAQLWQQ